MRSLDMPTPPAFTHDALTLPASASLPDPFTFASGRRVQKLDEWPARRRELRALLERYALGPYPPAASHVEGTLNPARDVLTVAVQVADRRIRFEARVSLPRGRGPFPAFVVIHQNALGPERLNAQGIAHIQLAPHAIAVDQRSVDANGVPQPLRQGLFYDLYGSHVRTGALLAWAWAVHRIVDALADVPLFDAGRVGVNGFSRWGKAALVAGAFDERIALTVPSSSGQAGVGNFRSAENAGNVQTIQQIADEAPHWFGDGFRDEFGRGTANAAARFPVDAHCTLALVAPRALLATEGTADSWNNPPGPALSMQAARLVYEYLGARAHIGFRCSAGVGHVIAPEQADAVSVFARRFLLGDSGAPIAIFDEPYGPPSPELLPWRAPAQRTD
jgi:hypothetical protein